MHPHLTPINAADTSGEKLARKRTSLVANRRARMPRAVVLDIVALVRAHYGDDVLDLPTKQNLHHLAPTIWPHMKGMTREETLHAIARELSFKPIVGRSASLPEEDAA